MGQKRSNMTLRRIITPLHCYGELSYAPENLRSSPISRRAFPRGLKPSLFFDLYGTAEAVPFQNIDLIRDSLECHVLSKQRGIPQPESLPGLSAGSAFRVYPLRAERAEAGNLNPEKK